MTLDAKHGSGPSDPNSSFLYLCPNKNAVKLTIAGKKSKVEGTSVFFTAYKTPPYK